MECTEPVLIPTSSASSQTVTRWSYMTKVRTWSVSSSFRLVEGLPERSSLSTDVRPSLNRLYHSLICVMPVASSLKTRWIFRMVSTWLSPSFWQNLMQYLCWSCSVIFAESKNATRAAYALSLTRWLHATDAVCWRGKKPRMCMKVPSTSLPQHTSRASLVFAEKNYVGYFLNRPRRLQISTVTLRSALEWMHDKHRNSWIHLRLTTHALFQPSDKCPGDQIV